MGFYRAYKTKEEAEEAAKKQRFDYKNVTVRWIKHFFSDGRNAYGVYVYDKRQE